MRKRICRLYCRFSSRHGYVEIAWKSTTYRFDRNVLGYGRKLSEAIVRGRYQTQDRPLAVCRNHSDTRPLNGVARCRLIPFLLKS